MLLTTPEWHDGRQLWVDPEVQDIVDRLQNGDPSIGWEGDPRLALYRTEDHRWELWRLEESGQMVMVCRSKPGLGLDARLILQLMRHDARRGNDALKVLQSIVDHNDRLEERREAEAVDALMGAREKVDWSLLKDLGEHRPFVAL